MKLLLPILFLFFISCEIKSNKAEISNAPTKISYSEIKKENKKFVFVIIDYEDPKLHHIPGDNRYGVEFKEIAYTDWVKKRSYSNIVEYSNFTEDDGYKLMDKVKKQLRFTDNRKAELFLDCPMTEEQYITMLKDDDAI